MRCRCCQVIVLAGGLVFAASASAQEIVHALSGKLTAMDATAKTIQLSTNDGSDGTFSFAPKKSQAVSFDRDVQTEAGSIASLSKTGDEVVLFFYGNNSVRTAVAVKDLGPGPFDTVEGTVTHYDRHQRTLTLKTAMGKTQSFTLGPKAVADTTDGAVPADKFNPDKGDNVRVVARNNGGAETAVFVRD